MKKLVVVSAFAALACGLSTGVAAKDFASSYVDCGLGAMFAQSIETEGTRTAVAVVTNITWDWGTTAVSSGLSSEESCAGGKKKMASLLMNSYAQVENDLARGEGQYLTALQAAAGCQGAQAEAFNAAVRKDFSALAAKPGYTAQPLNVKAGNLFDVVNTSAKASCTV